MFLTGDCIGMLRSLRALMKHWVWVLRHISLYDFSAIFMREDILHRQRREGSEAWTQGSSFIYNNVSCRGNLMVSVHLSFLKRYGINLKLDRSHNSHICKYGHENLKVSWSDVYSDGTENSKKLKCTESERVVLILLQLRWSASTWDAVDP